MLFNSLTFYIFVTVVFLLYLVLPHQDRTYCRVQTLTKLNGGYTSSFNNQEYIPPFPGATVHSVYKSERTQKLTGNTDHSF